MSPTDYVIALMAAGMEENLSLLEMDRRAAVLLGVDERTTRRYRRGSVTIPRSIEQHLTTLARVATREKA
jgi:hypothetical protein